MKRLPLLLSLGLSALLLGFWSFTEPERSLTDAAQQQVWEVDAYLNRAEIVQYAADGSPAQHILAKRIAHYPEDDTTRLEAPRVQILRQQQAPVTVHAVRGTIGADERHLILEEAVEIESHSPDNPYRLETEKLTLEPKSDYAETDLPVTIRSQHGTTTAKGMKAYLKEGRIILVSKVRGTYEPQ